MMSLVNDLLKFTSSDTQICWKFLPKKNVSSFCSAKAIHIFFQQKISEYCILNPLKTVNEMTLNELTTLWTTGPWLVIISASNGPNRRAVACRHTTIDYLCDRWCVWPKMWWSNKRLGGSVLILKKNKHSENFRDLAETNDTMAVPIIATKQPSIPIARG